MHERADDRAKSDSSHTDERDEDDERDPDFRQRVAQLGYYRILGDPQAAFAEAMREYDIDLESLQSLVVRFERDGDRFTVEFSREVVVGGVRFSKVVTGKLFKCGFDDLKGAENDRGPVGRFPPPTR